VDNTGATRTTATIAVTLVCDGEPTPTPAPSTYAISGQVTGAGGNALSGVTVTMSGAQSATATTSPDGRYTFAGVPAGTSGTVAPSLPGYEFTPASRSFTSLNANQTADFTASARVNYALAAQGATVAASSTMDTNRTPAAAINGDRTGRHWGTNATTGSGWHDATNNAFPDWLEVTFNGAKTINEIGLFSVQDNLTAPAAPTDQLTFTKYGLTAFRLEYWTGAAWAQIPGGAVTSNNKVWRKLTFAPLTTTKIRVVSTGALAGYSRIVELEAWGEPPAATPPPALVNHALAAQGATAAASSTLDSGRTPLAAIIFYLRVVNWVL
jgi:hypothetical protein